VGFAVLGFGLPVGAQGGFLPLHGFQHVRVGGLVFGPVGERCLQGCPVAGGCDFPGLDRAVRLARGHGGGCGLLRGDVPDGQDTDGADDGPAHFVVDLLGELAAEEP
jgi:hypothetical protein